MKILNYLCKRHPYPWYWRQYDVLKLSELNVPPPPKILYRVSPKHAKLSLMSLDYQGGSKLRLEQLKHLVANLFRLERIETTYIKGEECRGYVERLVRDAITYGDTHQPTMEMVSWWLKGQEDLIHKLYKVLSPRYRDYSSCVTELYKRSSRTQRLCVLELKGNPLPPMKPFVHDFKYSLNNVLLNQIKEDNILKNAKTHKESHTINNNSILDNRGIPLNINE